MNNKLRVDRAPFSGPGMISSPARTFPEYESVEFHLIDVERDSVLVRIKNQEVGLRLEELINDPAKSERKAG